MPGPIPSLSGRDPFWFEPPPPSERSSSEPLASAPDARPGVLCGDPKSVIAGAFCRDDTAVSNACRRAQPRSVDAYLCDDPGLKRAQDWVAKTAWDVLVKVAVSAFTRIWK
jgi:hypothetical protein